MFGMNVGEWIRLVIQLGILLLGAVNHGKIQQAVSQTAQIKQAIVASNQISPHSAASEYRSAVPRP